MLSLLDRVTIRTRLFAATFGMIFLLVGLGLFAVDRLQAVNAVSAEIDQKWMPALTDTANLNESIGEYRRTVLQHVVSADADLIATLDEDIANQQAALQSAFDAYAKHAGSSEGRALYDELGKALQAYFTESAVALGYSREGDATGAQDHIAMHNSIIGAKIKALIGEIDSRIEQGSEATAARGQETYTTVRMLIFGVIGASLMIGTIVGFFIVQSITRSMRAVTVPMGGLAAGDLSVEIPYRGQKTEVGQIADAVQVFKDALIEKQRADEATRAEAEEKAERARRLEALTAGFETKVGGLVQALSSAATEMEATAQSMSATAEQTDQQSVAVAAASEQASANVQTVAGASEELSASIREIAGQVEQSAHIASRAVEEANRTDATVGQLAEAAQRIGDVLNLISSIAAQTNLLALNATIEAARAGDAGKGFAVVASEVKNLANQTSKATEEIAGQIAAIQETTQGVVGAIRGIGGTIGEISEIAATIASAVEQQRAATQEIARNVQEAARGTQEVTANIEGVKRASADTGAAATQVLGAAGSLSEQSEALSVEVREFLDGVKAA